MSETNPNPNPKPKKNWDEVVAELEILKEKIFKNPSVIMREKDDRTGWEFIKSPPPKSSSRE